MHTRLTILFAMLPALATAEPFLVPGFDQCAEAKMAKGEALRSCVNDAMATCTDLRAGDPTATACFVSAKNEWGGYLAQRLENIKETSEERISKIAEIEARYELERNLRECDRHIELLLLDVPQDDRSEFIRSHCEATAVASTLVTLILRSGQKME